MFLPNFLNSQPLSTALHHDIIELVEVHNMPQEAENKVLKW